MMLRTLALMAFAAGALSIAAQPAPEVDPPSRHDGDSVAGREHSTTPALESLLRTSRGPVHLIDVQGEIDLGLAAYLRRALSDAHSAGASAVIVNINTPGGRVDAALEMKDALLGAPLPTVGLVNRQAYSAGALIALSTEHMLMVPGSVIGAAAPVMGTGEMAGEKMVSALRAAFAAAAERRGRDPLVAEAMVDEAVVVEDLVGAGRLLTLTHDQALARGIADGSVASLEVLLERLSPNRTEIVSTAPSFAERMVRFLTNPVVASLLMSLGFLGLFFELQTPGWGLGGSIAVVCLGLYFWGHHLAGLAGLESAILIGLGIVLMAAEVFLIPGFGVAGMLGLVAFVAGLFLSRVSPWGLPGEVTRAVYVVGASLLMMIAGAWAMLLYLPKNRFFAGLVLSGDATGEPPSEDTIGPPWGGEAAASYMGRRGVAMTDLRPSGTIEMDGGPLDVVTEGAYVSAGSLVEVVEDSGSRRVVRAVREDTERNEERG